MNHWPRITTSSSLSRFSPNPLLLPPKPELLQLLRPNTHMRQTQFGIKMGCGVNSPNTTILCRFSARKSTLKTTLLASSSNTPNQASLTSYRTLPEADAYTVNFRTLGACKLGISRYPDFEYDARGGTGTGSGTRVEEGEFDDILVNFDLETLYIPPLTSNTTKFLGLPMPPFLKIDIIPEHFQGSINANSGKVDLEFTAKFWFSVGSVYRAPSLLVKTVLTSEESIGRIRRGRGDRLNEEGKCRLIGVAIVDPIDDVFMNTFLGLPTECLADLNALISFSGSC